MDTTDEWDDDQTVEFLAVAGAIGMLYKSGASISAAEGKLANAMQIKRRPFSRAFSKVGCQGEVGVASSMAAAAVAHVQGGSVDQIEDAAEAAMEHSIGEALLLHCMVVIVSSACSFCASCQVYHATPSEGWCRFRASSATFSAQARL